jgi:hypothetical protein
VASSPESSRVRNLLVTCAFLHRQRFVLVTTGDDWSTTESIYYAFITVLSVGYGDFFPTTQDARMFTIFFIPVGIALLLKQLSAIREALYEHRYEQIMVPQIQAVFKKIQEDRSSKGMVMTLSDFQLQMLVSLDSAPKPAVLAMLKAQFETLDTSGDGVLGANVSPPVLPFVVPISDVEDVLFLGHNARGGDAASKPATIDTRSA